MSHREFAGSDGGFRHFLIAVPVAEALVRDAGARLLVTRRAHEPGLGMLGLSGGLIDESDEAADQAASRDVDKEGDLAIRAARSRDPASCRCRSRYLVQRVVWPTIDLFYVADVDSFDAVRLDPGEVAEWMAFAPREIPLSDSAFATNAEASRRLRRSGARPGDGPTPPRSASTPGYECWPGRLRRRGWL